MHAGFDEGAWITTAQTVAQMLVAPAAVWMGSVYGPRRVLLIAALAFSVISLITPEATNLPTLLALQFAGGLATGMFVPLTLSFVLLNTPPKYWAYGIAIYALNLELSLNISASLEGWYVDHLSWRWIFWQNVPLALAMAIALVLGMQPRRVDPKLAPNDRFGLLAGGIGLALIYAGLDQGNRLDWLNSGLVWGLLLSGIVLLSALYVHEARTPHPAPRSQRVVCTTASGPAGADSLPAADHPGNRVPHSAVSGIGARLPGARSGPDVVLDRRAAIDSLPIGRFDAAAVRPAHRRLDRFHLRERRVLDGGVHDDAGLGLR